MPVSCNQILSFWFPVLHEKRTMNLIGWLWKDHPFFNGLWFLMLTTIYIQIWNKHRMGLLQISALCISQYKLSFTGSKYIWRTCSRGFPHNVVFVSLFQNIWRILIPKVQYCIKYSDTSAQETQITGNDVYISNFTITTFLTSSRLISRIR